MYQLSKTVNDMVDDNFREPTFNLEGTNVNMDEVKEELLNTEFQLKKFGEKIDIFPNS